MAEHHGRGLDRGLIPADPEATANLSTQKHGAWTVVQQHLITWLSLPSGIRTPKTLGAYSEEAGYSETTLRTWQVLPGFSEAVLDARHRLVRAGSLGRVLQGQVNKAIRDEDTEAARFLYQATASMPEKQSAGGTTQVNVLIVNSDEGLNPVAEQQ